MPSHPHHLAAPADGPATHAARRDSLDRDSLMIVQIDGMHSHACEQAILCALRETPGVREPEVDFPSGQASVIFDARKTTAHQIVEAIEAAGYACGDPALGSGGGKVE